MTHTSMPARTHTRTSAARTTVATRGDSAGIPPESVPPLVRIAGSFVALLCKRAQPFRNEFDLMPVDAQGVHSVSAGQVIDRIIRALGGTYRITTPWGVVEVDPLPLADEALLACYKRRLVANAGAIRAAYDVGRYKASDFAGPDKAAKLASKIDVGSRESLERTIAAALDGISSAPRPGTIPVESMSMALLDLIDAFHAASGGRLSLSSLPLVSGVSDLSLLRLRLPIAEMETAATAAASAVDKRHALHDVVRRIQAMLRAPLRLRPRDLATMIEQVRTSRVADLATAGERLWELSREHLSERSLLVYVDGIVDVLRAAGCRVEIVVGDRTYVFAAEPHRTFAAEVHAAAAADDIAVQEPVPPKDIANLEHRDIIRLIADGQRGIALQRWSHEHIRRICIAYGYDRLSRIETSRPNTLGSASAANAARALIRSWHDTTASAKP